MLDDCGPSVSAAVADARCRGLFALARGLVRYLAARRQVHAESTRRRSSRTAQTGPCIYGSLPRVTAGRDVALALSSSYERVARSAASISAGGEVAGARVDGRKDAADGAPVRAALAALKAADKGRVYALWRSRHR